MERGNHLQKRLTVTLAHINISQIVARTKVDCSIKAHWASSAVRQHKQLLQLSFLFVLTVVVLFLPARVTSLHFRSGLLWLYAAKGGYFIQF